MALTKRTMRASPEEIFDTLLDPYEYPKWVVGARAIRAVDESWPAVGAAFHHKVGTEAAEIKDKTEILALDPPGWIELRAFARPLGVAHLVIKAEPSEEGTIVSIAEEPEKGTLLRNVSYLVDPLIHFRNMESLRRLEGVVRTRSASR